MADIEHRNITDPNIHEAKGAATALLGQLLTGNGDGTATFQTPTPIPTIEMGWYDYNDLATQTTPIALSVAGTKYDLTNDGLGPNTQTTYGIDGIPNIWDVGTSRFLLSGLDIGDTAEIRADITYTTTSANTAIQLELEFAVGTGSAFTVVLLPSLNIKSASSIQIVHERGFYIGSAVVRDNPCRIRAVADSTGSTIKVNGWYTRVIKR